jgi:hypothetical protein
VRIKIDMDSSYCVRRLMFNKEKACCVRGLYLDMYRAYTL